MNARATSQAYVAIEILLSLAPLSLTYPAWRFQQRLNPPLSNIRLILFRWGLLMSIVSCLVVTSSWFEPFPLVPDGRGGYSDIRNSMLFDAGLLAAFVTIGLAAFGRGWSRLLLAASAIVVAFVALAALLSKDV